MLAILYVAVCGKNNLNATSRLEGLFRKLPEQYWRYYAHAA